MRTGDRTMPETGGALGGMPHPAEKEIRRKELPPRDGMAPPAVFNEKSRS
ncbi:MAG: hypothetical protein J5586_03160 [Clostridia bacterium]|nr:hypothetical protein [Clostridia bacterium]